jgi:anaerobic selenocysteine-containing dehydrogenase
MTSIPISSALYQVRVGGDVAVLKGLMKAFIDADDAAAAADMPLVLDWDFIRGHTHGIEALAEDLRATSWEAIERGSGLSRDQLRSAASVP